jgi:hypothetical protein
MIWRQGKPRLTMRPGYDSGGAVGVVKKIWGDLVATGNELDAIGKDVTTLEAVVADFEAVEAVAAEDIATGDCVTAAGFVASAMNPLHADRVLGIAAQDAVLGQRFVVVTRGNARVSGFEAGDILWLGAAGQLTTTVPVSGFQQRVALAIDNSTVVVLLGIPIVLA